MAPIDMRYCSDCGKEYNAAAEYPHRCEDAPMLPDEAAKRRHFERKAGKSMTWAEVNAAEAEQFAA